jgi:curved DNA-binding protein CbpA
LDRDAYEVLEVHPAAHQVVIHAAYRALAAEYHPDHDPSSLAHKRMTELNAAYARIRTRELREAYDVARGRQQAQSGQGAIVRPPPGYGTSDTSDPDTVDFGRYAGWTIPQLARHDPEYLRWLSRQSAGVRYRERIAKELAGLAPTRALRPEEREFWGSSPRLN